jgi:hypothetical protein
MDSGFDRFEFSVRRRGRVASRILNDGALGRVAAVFDNSFYIEIQGGLACIGNEGLAGSPLNLITAAPENTNWPASGLRLNAKVSISANAMRVGERFSFGLADAEDWMPDPAPVSWGVDSLKKGLARFREAAAGRVPFEGLGSLIDPDFGALNEQAVGAIAERPVKSLAGWLTASMRKPGCEPGGAAAKGLLGAHLLLGLGPGLTPSGDDFIGGMMVALHGLAEPAIRRRLWISCRRRAFKIGNRIAYAHLAAAAEGLASAAIHRALAAIMEGRLDAGTLAGIDAIGHTSGWDAMAGALTAFDAWIQGRDH